ncbi:hypothetical protein [Cupriavidus sp. CuC1]|uniref:hypothetical protein n=1 Tax=Cupriavidus sp. CuC1 TaxID=3373131 RepID=UPI0037D1A04F
MRDVTDNRIAELPVGEAKRGRGRPPKANALSNAERQAAYRARRKSSVTVTENGGVFRGEQLHQDVGGLEDAMAELRAELDATKAELAEAHETIDEMTGYVNARDRENDHLVEVHDELVRSRVELAAAHKRIELAEEERNKAFSANGALKVTVAGLQMELGALKKGAGKSVTRNGNPVDFDFMVQVVKCVRSARDWRKRSELFDLDGWRRFNCSAATSDEMRLALQDAITGDSTSRMLRNAKKREAQERNEKT